MEIRKEALEMELVETLGVKVSEVLIKMLVQFTTKRNLNNLTSMINLVLR